MQVNGGGAENLSAGAVVLVVIVSDGVMYLLLLSLLVAWVAADLLLR